MPRRRAPWWAYAVGAAFVAYFALLVSCDLWRPESEGLSLAFGDGVVVAGVRPGSPADRAGVLVGDRIAAVNGQALAPRKMAWVAVTANIVIGQPLLLEIERNGGRRAVPLVPGRESWRYWTTREGIDLLVVRGVQLVTLALALIILFKRPHDAVARLGAWALAAVSVYCVVLPYRLAAAWRGLPWPIGLALWLPFFSSLIAAGLLLSFFLVFPARRLRASRVSSWIAVPVVASAVPYARYHAAAIYTPDRVLGLADGFWALEAVSLIYLAATVASAVWCYRRLSDETERRRLRVLLAGAMFGSIAAGVLVVGWWQTGTLTLFGAPVMGWLFPTLLTVPLSFAYAILRHRLFDVRLIVRQGVRYALARRLLLSLVPALLLVMAIDLYLHRQLPLAQVLATRTSTYVVLAGVALVAQSQRQRWLVALDRRFFRDRYDAQQLLLQVAGDIREAGQIERVAGRVTAQIQLALHARFVVLLYRSAGGEAYRALAASPPGDGPQAFPASGKLPALARLVGRPLQLPSAETGWPTANLSREELDAVRSIGLELVVPVVTDGEPEAFLALGERRSEEPYAGEDCDLLQTIAATLALVLPRRPVQGPPTSFRECPACGACYGDSESDATCGTDGQPLARVNLPRVLGGRYRLDSRLGRGGMAAVYAGRDLALDRPVAVKVLRDDLAGSAEAAERFEREARMVAAFSHPHVVTVYDFGVTAQGRAFLVMELLEGRSLRAMIADAGPLPPERALDILREICSAVDAAHRRRLVHRDLKPENIFLARVEGRETAKVLDFGIAKDVRPGATDGRQTAAGLLVGTPEYMAPEQLRGEEAHPGWDVWALGVIACEMLTGRHPFSMLVLGVGAPAVPAAHTAVLDVALAPIGPALPAFFARALAIDGSRRPSTPAAFIDELGRALKGSEA